MSDPGEVEQWGICILTGAGGENPDDCTTHAHESDDGGEAEMAARRGAGKPPW